jgi:hypothetical protein
MDVGSSRSPTGSSRFCEPSAYYLIDTTMRQASTIWIRSVRDSGRHCYQNSLPNRRTAPLGSRPDALSDQGAVEPPYRSIELGSEYSAGTNPAKSMHQHQ